MVSKAVEGETRKRKKVSKACVSCRRRKIKCTGTQPCTNCQVYQCQCTFADKKFVTSGVEIKLNEEKKKFTAAVQNLLGPEISPEHSGSGTSYTPSEIDSKPTGDSILADSLHEVDLNTIQLNNFKLFTNENVTFENGLFENDLEDLPKYKEYKDALNQLLTLPEKNSTIRAMIEDTKDKILEITNSWQPKVNLEKMPDLLRILDPADAVKSVETQLMINKYRPRVHLSRYSFWSFNSSNSKISGAGATKSDMQYCEGSHTFAAEGKEGGYLSSLPLIDEIFGLYHPFEALSLRGIAYLTQKYSVLRPKEPGNDQIIRANIFILLRFFDLCWLHLNEDRVWIANPLESYIQRTETVSNKMGVSPTNSTANSNVSAASSPGPNNANNKDTVAFLLKRLPSRFENYLTPATVSELLNTMSDDLEMFKLLLKLCDNHRIKIENFLLNVNSINDKMEKQAGLDEFDILIDVHDILLTLCYTYYNSTMYYLNHLNSLEYLELLIKMLEYGEWSQEMYGFSRVLNIALDCALKAGFSRWEYYVGLDEVTAEKRRKIWWKLYGYDRSLMLEYSYLPTIDDSKMNCLLTKEFRDAGFLDHNDFIKRLHIVPRSEVFDDMSIESLIFYAKCGTYQVVGHFYSEVLYSEKYTSIRNIAKSSECRINTLQELFVRLQLFMMRMNKIKEHSGKLFEIAENPRNTPKNISRAQMFAIINFTFEHQVAYCIVLRVAVNLGVRMAVYPKPSYLKDKVMSMSKHTYTTWSNMNKIMLNLETDYDVWLCLEKYSLVYLLMVTWMYDECVYIQHEDIINVINIFRRLSNLKDLYLTKNGVEKQTLKLFSSTFTLFCILSRILLTEYVGLKRVNMESFSDIFDKEGGDITELVKIIFDHNSYCYKIALEHPEESGFHTTIKNMLKNEYNISWENQHSKRRNDSRTAKSPLKRSYSDQIFPQREEDSPNNVSVTYSKMAQFMQSGQTGSKPINALLDPPLPDEGTPKYPTSQIGTIDKRLFQPFDLGILEEFFSSTDFNDLNSI